jgi:DNA-binding transcriptional MerR regulator
VGSQTLEPGLRSTADVARELGLTYRQLDYWDLSELLVPTQRADGTGTKRGYSDLDVAKLRLLIQLWRGGFSLSRIRRAFAGGAPAVSKLIEQLDREIDQARELLAEVEAIDGEGTWKRRRK